MLTSLIIGKKCYLLPRVKMAKIYLLLRKLLQFGMDVPWIIFSLHDILIFSGFLLSAPMPDSQALLSALWKTVAD